MVIAFTKRDFSILWHEYTQSYVIEYGKFKLISIYHLVISIYHLVIQDSPYNYDLLWWENQWTSSINPPCSCKFSILELGCRHCHSCTYGELSRRKSAGLMELSGSSQGANWGMLEIVAMGKPWGNHRKTIGKCWFHGISWWTYPLVIWHKHGTSPFLLGNSLFRLGHLQ